MARMVRTEGEIKIHSSERLGGINSTTAPHSLNLKELSLMSLLTFCHWTENTATDINSFHFSSCENI